MLQKRIPAEYLLNNMSYYLKVVVKIDERTQDLGLKQVINRSLLTLFQDHFEKVKSI